MKEEELSFNNMNRKELLKIVLEEKKVKIIDKEFIKYRKEIGDIILYGGLNKLRWKENKKY